MATDEKKNEVLKQAKLGDESIQTRCKYIKQN